ncbi:MAG: hypothetical protein J6V54_01265 [Bacteroidales bacterium]|nr:hypothetical protein [Bacteroidales bacterium]
MVRLSIFRKKIAKNGELKPMYYLTFYGAERLNFEKMCDLIAERTTLDSSEVDFVLSVLQDVVIENLQIGRGIELGKLGCLEPSMHATAVEDLKDINLKTIKKSHIIYKPSIEIKKALKNLKYRIDKRCVIER